MSIVIKKFYSQTCQPCKVLTNWLTEIDFDKHGALLESVDVATSSDEELTQLNVSSVPTMIYYRNGIEMTRSVGLTPVEEVLDSLQYTKEAK